MSNVVEYSESLAFHPGYYVADIVEDMGITQVEFAARMGTTPKTLSKLINGQINLSNDLAKKLSAMLGTSVDIWLNLQKAYDEKVIEIERQKELDKQIQIVQMIDYSYFERVANLKKTKVPSEQVEGLCQYLIVSDLSVLCQPDFLVQFRTGVSNVNEKNVINSRAWLQTALNFAKGIQTQPFDAEKLKSFVPEIRTMTLQDPSVFVPRLRAVFSECGVAFVLLPHLKNSGINGAVKWVNHNRVVLAMNDRRSYADTFWFSLFHEIKHVLQQATSRVFISMDNKTVQTARDKLEEDADLFAQNTLISPADFRRFSPSMYTSDAEIIDFARKIGIHPGVVAGRLQHDGIIKPNRCSSMKVKYRILVS